MTDAPPEVTGYRRPGVALAALLLCAWGPTTQSAPTLQDIQVAGRVLHFQDAHLPREITLAIVYNAAEVHSRDEAVALGALLGSSLLVGDLVMRPRLVEQAYLSKTTGFSAIFTTTGVDDALIGESLRQHQVPCLTRHLEQVEHGTCIVAICSVPTVRIVVNEANAVIAGIHFATAFRMMVREI